MPHRSGIPYSLESFDLLIGSGSSGNYPVTIIQSPAGEGNGVCRLDPAEFSLQDALISLQNKDVDRAFLEQLGQYLFEELFAGDVGDLYRTSLGMVRGQGSRLRIHLRMEPPELAVLPWEYLFDADEDRFLAISAETVVVRYVPMRLPIRSLKVTPPLRILAVAASPSDLAELDVVKELDHLRQALADPLASGQIRLETLDHGTMESIGEAMRTFQPHVFHFVGHGLFADGEAHLALEDAAGASTLVAEGTFRELFADCRETRLVVLNACETGTTSAVQPLAGMAPQLLQRQVSAVVAMQAPILDEAALILSRVFYDSVALGYPVDAAIAEARRAIFLELGPENGEWGVPVLFMRAHDGQLFAVAEPEPAPDTEIPAPPQPTQPPDLVDFVGREAELAAYAQALEREHLAIITGMAGVGKTAMAVALIARQAESRPIFWHSFYEDEGVDAIIWKAAGWLAWQGRDDLWRMIQKAQQQGGKPPPPETLFDYLLQQLAGHNYLICLDDLHHVGEDPLLGQFVERLRSVVQRGELSLLVTARFLPDFMQEFSLTPLEGLTVADTLRLLAHRHIQLADDDAAALHQITGGNAELLNLAVDLLHSNPNPGQMIARLDEAEDVEHYLLVEIDDGLDEEEREVMAAVAILLGHPASRDMVEVVLDSQHGRQRTLVDLGRRHLLLTAEGPNGRIYSQHAMVQTFYYNSLSRHQRRTMHQRAGDYYELDEVDLLKAARHHDLAGDAERAAALATANVTALINQGEARSLYLLLNQLAARRLSVETEQRLLEATGDVAYLLGELKQAVAAFHSAADGAGDALLQIRRWRKLGEVQARLGEYGTALSTFRQAREGLAALPTSPEIRAEDARLAVGIGTVLLNQGEYDAARTHAQTALDAVDTRDASPPLADLHDVLGKIHYFQGDFPAALAQFEAALALRQNLEDQRGVLKSYSNLAVVYGVQGRYVQSIQSNTEALEIAEAIGDLVATSVIYQNIATDYSELQQYDLVVDYNMRSLDLAMRIGNIQQVTLAHYNLGDSYLYMNDFDQATQHLLQARELAISTGGKHILIGVGKKLAELFLVQGKGQEALDECQQALQLAIESDSHYWHKKITPLMQAIHHFLEKNLS